MSALNFVRPGNISGVGFLIVFGGVPQFSIAWDATREPERISLQNAAGEGLQIDGKPVSQFEIVEVEGKPVLREVEQVASAQDQEQSAGSQTTDGSADQTEAKKKQAKA